MKHFTFQHFVFVLLFVFSFVSCKVYHEAKTEQELLRITSDSDIAQDEEVKELILPYKQQLDAKMNQVIGVCAKELTKKLPESTLGNWASDAVLAQCNKQSKRPLDFAFVNYGGLRIPSIPKGEITTGKIFELMPFDNAMVILETDGHVVQQLFQSIAKRGGWPVSKGVVCTISKNGELKSVLINGQPLDVNRKYRIGLSDYIANGGDKCSFFKGIPMEETGLKLRDAFLQQVKDTQAKGAKINATIEGRIVIEL